MERMDIGKRKYKLYSDNREYTLDAISSFIKIYSESAYGEFSTCLQNLQDKSHNGDMRAIFSYYKDGLFNLSGEITLHGVDISKALTNEEILYLDQTTVCFDKTNKLNGWLVSPEGIVYPAKNHVNFIHFLTLLGIDASSYIRVTSAPIGLTRLNFSEAKDYIDGAKPLMITKQQVQALYNLKCIEEARRKEYPLKFKDYLIDSMIGGFLSDENNRERNCEIIQQYSPEYINARQLIADAKFYKKNKDRYEEDFGVELII